MVVKTKKYKLDTNTFVRVGIWDVVVEWWWVWFIPVAVAALPPLFLQGALWWSLPTAVLLIVLYLLFWGAQFLGVTQMEQFKPFFDKIIYEFDTQKIVLKMGKQQPMALKWEAIQKAKKNKDHFILTLSRAQFFYLPFDIFRNDNEVKIFEKILQRKNLL